MVYSKIFYTIFHLFKNSHCLHIRKLKPFMTCLRFTTFTYYLHKINLSNFTTPNWHTQQLVLTKFICCCIVYSNFPRNRLLRLALLYSTSFHPFYIQSLLANDWNLVSVRRISSYTNKILFRFVSLLSLCKAHHLFIFTF